MCLLFILIIVILKSVLELNVCFFNSSGLGFPDQSTSRSQPTARDALHQLEQGKEDEPEADLEPKLKWFCTHPRVDGSPISIFDGILGFCSTELGNFLLYPSNCIPVASDFPSAGAACKAKLTWPSQWVDCPTKFRHLRKKTFSLSTARSYGRFQLSSKWKMLTRACCLNFSGAHALVFRLPSRENSFKYLYF